MFKRLLKSLPVVIFIFVLGSSALAQDDGKFFSSGDFSLGTHWSADGSRVALVSYVIGDRSGVMVLDAETGEQIYLTEHPTILEATTVEEWWSAGLSFSPDESQILSWPGDAYAYFWDAETGELLHQVEVLSTNIQSGIWRPDGKQVMLVTQSAVHLIDAVTGFETKFSVMGEDVATASYSHNGERIMVALTAGRVEINDLRLSKNIIMQSEADIRGAQWNPDGNQILTWSSDGRVNVWNVATGALAYSLSHDKPILDASWSPDGQYFLVVDEETEWGAPEYFGRIWIYESLTGNLVHQVEVQEVGYGGAVWSPDSQYFAAWTASINYATSTYIYNLTDTEPIDSAGLNGTAGVIWKNDMRALLLWSQVDGTLFITPLDPNLFE